MESALTPHGVTIQNLKSELVTQQNRTKLIKKVLLMAGAILIVALLIVIRLRQMGYFLGNQTSTIIPFRHFNYQLYSGTEIISYSYSFKNDSEQLNLENKAFETQASLVVLPQSQSAQNDESSKVTQTKIAGEAGQFSESTQQAGGGESRRGEYNLYRKSFIFNHGHFLFQLNTDSTSADDLMLKDAVADISPIDEPLDSYYKLEVADSANGKIYNFENFSISLPTEFIIDDYSITSQEGFRLNLEATGILKDKAKVAIFVKEGQLQPQNSDSLIWTKFDFKGKEAYKTRESTIQLDTGTYRNYPEKVIINLDGRYLEIDTQSGVLEKVGSNEFFSKTINSIEPK